MSFFMPSRLRLFHLLAIVLILSMVVPPRTSVQAQDDLTTLIKQFEASMNTVAGGSRETALKLLPHYQEYKHLVNAKNSTISRTTVQAFDNQIINMCQEAWRDVSLKPDAGLSYIVPVGTLGTRDKGGAYIPGKSDKDFIPQGSKATQAVDDFNKTFVEKFNVKPEVVDVNALDPTKIETWPDRVAAAQNIEKYNTKGGINWLDNQLYKDKPNLWRYDVAADVVGEVGFNDLVKEAPPKMRLDDALGFASDNLRFREGLLLDGKLSDAEKAFKTSKYDLRTLEAFELAGGKLTAEQRELVEMANIFRKPPGNTLDSALKAVAERTGMSTDDAVRYYMESMEKLNGEMTKTIANRYLTLMGPGKSTALLGEELAASMGNMPARYSKDVEWIAATKLGSKEIKDIKALSEAFRSEVAKTRFGIVYFNERAYEVYHLPYDKLDAPQRLALHTADERAAAFARKAFTTLGYGVAGLFMGYSIYNAYQEGKQRGTTIGLLSGAGQAFIEILEYGYPPAVAVDVISRLGAGVVNLGISAYKNDVLNSFYNRYKNGEKLEDLLDTYGVQHYNAGGLRQMALEIREENPDMTDAEIDEAIKQYFVNRLKIEKEQEAIKKTYDELYGFLERNGIQLSEDYDDNFDFEHEKKEEFYKAMANWLKWAAVIKAQLDADKIPYTDEEINFLVNRLLNRDHDDYVKGMQSQYETYGGKYAGKEKPKSTAAVIKSCDGIACLKLGGNAIISPKTIPPNPGTIWSGGGSFKEKPVDQPCDPGRNFGPFDIAGGAKAVAFIDGSPPVPNTWSLFNANTAMTVTFEPKTGSTFGTSVFLAGLAGQVENSKLKQEFDIPGPGRLYISINAPRGSGPLTGSCFGQGYSASLKILEMKTESSASSGTTFNSGDRVTTSVSAVVLVMEDGTKLMVHPNSAASFERDSSGRPVVRLEKGRIQFTSPPQGGKPIVVRVGDREIIRKGTEFIVRNDGDTQTVSVSEGSVTVNNMGGKSVTVPAGKELDMVSGSLIDYQHIDDNRNRMHNMRLEDLFIGDYTPELAGTVNGPTIADPLDKGWVWQDPGYNTGFEITGGQVKMTVPHGKCMGTYCDNTPVLMHKVTGDFDLQTKALLIGPNDRWVELNFMIYAPDSFIGLNSKQEMEDSLLAHTRIVGAGWNRGWNRSMLKNLNQIFQYGGKEIPDKSVLLKLTRRGDLIRSYWSLDNGKTWNLATHEQIILPETLYTGWLAIYGGEYPGIPDKTTITLSDIKLTGAALNSLPNPDWDYVYRQGAVSGSGDSVELMLDGSALGDVMAYRSEVQTGDFEIIASYDASPWDHEQGDGRGFNLVAESIDGNKTAYVGAFQNDYNKYQFQTNFNIGSVPRGSWQKMEGADFSGRLKLARVGSVIQAFVELGGEWIQIDKGYADLVNEPVVFAVQAFNNYEAANPSDVQVKFTIEEVNGSAVKLAADTEDDRETTPSEGETEIEEAEPDKSEESAKDETLVFSDNFSKVNSAWKSMSAAVNGTVTRKDGGLNFTVLQPQKYVSARVPWDFESPVEDVILSFKAKVQTPNMGAFGIFCRVSDTKDYYAVMLQPIAQGGGEYRFSKGKAGKTSNLTGWKKTNTLYGGEIEEQVTFSCIGDTISLEINGKQVEEITDKDVKSGNAVLYALSFEEVDEDNPYSVIFDDFKAEVP